MQFMLQQQSSVVYCVRLQSHIGTLVFMSWCLLRWWIKSSMSEYVLMWIIRNKVARYNVLHVPHQCCVWRVPLIVPQHQPAAVRVDTIQLVWCAQVSPTSKLMNSLCIVVCYLCDFSYELLNLQGGQSECSIMWVRWWYFCLECHMPTMCGWVRHL